ncbi:MAG: endonuclease/exonuclease/phosphatase family protein [Pirellulaceae bacterium]
MPVSTVTKWLGIDRLLGTAGEIADNIAPSDEAGQEDVPNSTPSPGSSSNPYAPLGSRTTPQVPVPTAPVPSSPTGFSNQQTTPNAFPSNQFNPPIAQTTPANTTPRSTLPNATGEVPTHQSTFNIQLSTNENSSSFAGSTSNDSSLSNSGPLLGSPSTPEPISNLRTTRIPIDNRALIIGTFNIQVFGQAKLGNSSVMEILVDIGRRFDLLALQEIRDKEQEVVPRYIEMLNANGANYRFVIGPRQGYTISKEQYAYIYDANKLKVIGEPFIAEDRTLHRAPMVVRFQSTEINENQAATFCLLNIHTDPDEVSQELGALKKVVSNVKAAMPEEDDFLVLGDFNAPTEYIDSLFAFHTNPHYIVQEGWVTNIREDRNYDNVIFDSRATREYTGQSGVFNFPRTYQLSLDEAKYVSDHLPVWAMFSIFEQNNNIANQETVDRIR